MLESIPELVPCASWPFPVWIKRGNGCAQVKDDVQMCHNIIDAEVALAGFRNRGIERVVVSEHLEGDLVKFYGVLGTPFFSWNQTKKRKILLFFLLFFSFQGFQSG